MTHASQGMTAAFAVVLGGVVGDIVDADIAKDVVGRFGSIVMTQAGSYRILRDV